MHYRFLKLLPFFFIALVIQSCISPSGRFLRETDNEGESLAAARNQGFLGLSLSFAELPDDLVWELQIELYNEASKETIEIKAPGQEIIEHKVFDKSPVIFAVSEGKFTLKSISLAFPAVANDIYKLSTEKLVLPLEKPLPPLVFKRQELLYLGDVSLEHDGNFIPGKPNYITKMHATWNLSAPVYGNTWAKINSAVKIFEFAPTPTGFAEAPLFYDKPSEGEIATFASGFGKVGDLDVQSLIVVGANQKGAALFLKNNNTVIRVESTEIDSHQAYALIASRDDVYDLLGFCFHIEKLEECSRPWAKVQKLPNRAAFNLGEIRYRGYVNDTSDRETIVENTILSQDFEKSLRAKIPFAVFRSFVLDENLQRVPKGKFVFVSDKGVREKWDPSSIPFLEAFKLKAIACDKELRQVDPYVTSDFELSFAVGKQGYLETSAQKGLSGGAFGSLKSCFDAELEKWKNLGNAEVLRGFGVRYTGDTK